MDFKDKDEDRLFRGLTYGLAFTIAAVVFAVVFRMGMEAYCGLR